MILTIKMTSGDEFQIELDESSTNQKSKLDEIKSAMINGTVFDADEELVLNGKFIESFAVQSIEEFDLD